MSMACKYLYLLPVLGNCGFHSSSTTKGSVHVSGNLIARSIHDLSAAAWFGGSLMGAVGLNGATSEAKDATERTRLSSLGWKKWSPVQTGAFAAHLAALGPILWENKGRYSAQHGVMAATWIKTAVTLVGASATLYAAVLGKKVDELAHEGARGATEPGAASSPDLAKAQKQLKLLQWAIPGFAASVIVLGAWHGEMQRPKNVKLGLLKK